LLDGEIARERFKMTDLVCNDLIAQDNIKSEFYVYFFYNDCPYHKDNEYYKYISTKHKYFFQLQNNKLEKYRLTVFDTNRATGFIGIYKYFKKQINEGVIPKRYLPVNKQLSNIFKINFTEWIEWEQQESIHSSEEMALEHLKEIKVEVRNVKVKKKELMRSHGYYSKNRNCFVAYYEARVRMWEKREYLFSDKRKADKFFAMIKRNDCKDASIEEMPCIGRLEFKEAVISLMIQKELEPSIIAFFKDIIEMQGNVSFDDYIKNWCRRLLTENIILGNDKKTEMILNERKTF
jgi:hypothetical protein